MGSVARRVDSCDVKLGQPTSLMLAHNSYPHWTAPTSREFTVFANIVYPLDSPDKTYAETTTVAEDNNANYLIRTLVMMGVYRP